MQTSDKIWLCIAGIALVALGVLYIMWPAAALLSLAWVIATLIFLDGIGYWVKVALVNKVENRFADLQERIRKAVEEVASAPEDK